MSREAPLWPTDLDEARRVQTRLAKAVETEDRFGPVRRIAALDAHFGKRQDRIWAAVALVDLADLELRHSILIVRPLDYPYIPGLLSFREAPAMLEALALLPEPPDMVLVDGQGIAHPRRFGIACHVGVLADLPTIGVAKSILVGRYDNLGADRGQSVPLIHRGAIVGAALRTRTAKQPVFVSTGHRIGLTSAVDIVLRCTRNLRLPEPIRLADAISRMHPPDPE